MPTIETQPNDTGIFVRIPHELKDIAKRNGLSFSDRLRAAIVLELCNLYGAGMLSPCDRDWVERYILEAPIPANDREDGFWGFEGGHLRFYKAVPADPPRDFWGNVKMYPTKMGLPVVVQNE
ncbi:MAG: hypothetical protein Q7J09_10500 [Methanocalculus sp.]|uniref:hypothetical protein n=1 Tax=Methanocalculus sp. TaxID=2004547 RepID=UPI00271D436E|nr:hypothetical protein [Methanocalculus sp.]MDO9540414.1 hypothetical protein [Methanocalculus sp.]